MDNFEQLNRNCGLCGEPTCESLREKVQRLEKFKSICPFYRKERAETQNHVIETDVVYEKCDMHGTEYDFVLKAVAGEQSARKIIRPFRPDLVEKLNIVPGSVVMGRPMGAGCPVTHVLQVYQVDILAGVLYTWAVGPRLSRNASVVDISAYNMVGFEGIAVNIQSAPKIGKAASFLPGFCMIRLVHHGLVNKIINTAEGILVRVEGIHIA